MKSIFKTLKAIQQTKLLVLLGNEHRKISQLPTIGYVQQDIQLRRNQRSKTLGRLIDGQETIKIELVYTFLKLHLLRSSRMEQSKKQK